MLFVPLAQTSRVAEKRVAFALRQQQTMLFALPIRIVACASIMKINPGFLAALAEVQVRCRVPVRFCFYMGFAQGLTVDYLREAIHDVLPEVNAHMEVTDHRQALSCCELFANPFISADAAAGLPTTPVTGLYASTARCVYVGKAPMEETAVQKKLDILALTDKRELRQFRQTSEQRFALEHSCLRMDW
jgi:hypothetical protein